MREGFYDNTLFHRVIDGFMVQGGGFDLDFNQKPTHEPIENEADNGLENRVGTLAMARTQDPHSATAQFFINIADNDFLNHRGKNLQGWGYCVFGEVVEGMEVVERIKSVKTTRRGMHADVPPRMSSSRALASRMPPADRRRQLTPRPPPRARPLRTRPRNMTWPPC